MPPVQIAREDLVALERPVLDELGVYASITRIVDVLKHDSILVRRSGIASTGPDFKAHCSCNSGQGRSRKEVLEQHRDDLTGDAEQREVFRQVAVATLFNSTNFLDQCRGS